MKNVEGSIWGVHPKKEKEVSIEHNENDKADDSGEISREESKRIDKEFSALVKGQDSVSTPRNSEDIK